MSLQSEALNKCFFLVCKVVVF